MSDKQRGLYPKYRVLKYNEAGRAQDEVQGRVFVLNIDTDPIAVHALGFYAMLAEKSGNEALANDLYEWLEDGPVEN